MNKEHDLSRFTKALSTLALAFEKKITEDHLDIYFRALDDLSIDDFEHAAALAIKQCKFFPKPVELREFIDGSADDIAIIAWQNLQATYRRAAFWTSVLFTDNAIALAIENVFVTWPLCSEQLATLKHEMLQAKQKAFCVAYRRAQRENKSASKYLRGFCEMNNIETVGQWKRGEPVTIGDRTIFTQPIFIQVDNGGRMIEAEFDFYSGALLTPLDDLVTRPAVRALAPAQNSKLISGETGEMIDAEEGKQIVADAVSDLVSLMLMPKVREPMSQEQWEARRQELKSQIEQIS